MEVDCAVIVGEAPAVNVLGGTRAEQLSVLRVKALPTDIPPQIEVDVSTLASMDVAIHVRDLNFNATWSRPSRCDTLVRPSCRPGSRSRWVYEAEGERPRRARLRPRARLPKARAPSGAPRGRRVRRVRG